MTNSKSSLGFTFKGAGKGLFSTYQKYIFHSFSNTDERPYPKVIEFSSIGKKTAKAQSENPDLKNKYFQKSNLNIFEEKK